MLLLHWAGAGGYPRQYFTEMGCSEDLVWGGMEATESVTLNRVGLFLFAELSRLGRRAFSCQWIIGRTWA